MLNDIFPSVSDMTRKVVFIVYPGFQLLGLSGPVCAFQIAKEGGSRRAYEIEIVSAHGGEVTCSAGLKVATTKALPTPIDTLIVVGGNAIWDDSTIDDVSSIIMRLGQRARRIASICTGAFALARVGLLNGKQATTHWRHISRLREDFREIDVVADRLFTHAANIWTSAGISAGLDLALALIEEDLGTTDTRLLAQELVVRQRQLGGQPQFSPTLELEGTSDRIRRVLTYAERHLAQPLTVNILADVACLSERQLSRAFRRETGLTVAKAIERIRADAARYRIEATFEPIEVISRSCGFGDPERMRRTFLRLFGKPPQALRRLHKVRAI
jgi:transcriptional regulator GlxA family with amidase domain